MNRQPKAREVPQPQGIRPAPRVRKRAGSARAAVAYRAYRARAGGFLPRPGRGSPRGRSPGGSNLSGIPACAPLRPAPEGTPFQHGVWRALLDIPFAETRSYGEIARTIGQPRSARAVGLANNQNPIAIIVPCHRVIGAGGSLVGYGGGVHRKKWLLQHELRFATLDQRAAMSRAP